MNKRRELLVALGASALVAPLGSFAQQQDKAWRLGVLETTSTNSVFLPAFRKGLNDLGYVEGKNLIIEYRSADGHLDRLAELAAELVRAKVDVIVPRATNAALAVKNATGVIPIVAVQIGSPQESGLVKSLAHPGENVTGLSSVSAELYEKRLELIKETVAGVKRIGGLTNLSNPDAANSWKRIATEGPSLGVQLQLLDVRKADDLAQSFDAAVKQGVGALGVVTRRPAAPVMTRCALLRGFQLLAAVTDYARALSVCFVEDHLAAVGRSRPSDPTPGPAALRRIAACDDSLAVMRRSAAACPNHANFRRRPQPAIAPPAV